MDGGGEAFDGEGAGGGAGVEFFFGDSFADGPVAFDERLGGGALGFLRALADDSLEVGEELFVFAFGDQVRHLVPWGRDWHNSSAGLRTKASSQGQKWQIGFEALCEVVSVARSSRSALLCVSKHHSQRGRIARRIGSEVPFLVGHPGLEPGASL